MPHLRPSRREQMDTLRFVVAAIVALLITTAFILSLH